MKVFTPAISGFKTRKDLGIVSLCAYLFISKWRKGLCVVFFGCLGVFFLSFRMTSDSMLVNTSLEEGRVLFNRLLGFRVILPGIIQKGTVS